MQQKMVAREQIIASLFWKLMERTGTQGIQFVVQIILARLLLPDDYGIIALIAVFITVSNIFIQSGFNVALIQKKDVHERDYSSVFYLSLLTAAICYLALFYVSPVIAAFYNIPQIVPVLRILSITLFFGAVNGVQNAIISKTMQFKKVFYSSLGGAAISGTLGIILAYQGFRVWALVTQQLTQQFVMTLILYGLPKWSAASMRNIIG